MGVDGTGRVRRRRRSTRVRDYTRGTRSSSPLPAGMPCRVPAGRSEAKWSPRREGGLRAAEATPFDEAAVRSLAASQNETRTEMIVSRARVQSKIFALLSPEQREREKKFRPWGGKGPGRDAWK